MVDRAQLDSLVKRRDALVASKNKLLGRLESAKADVAAVEAECIKRGIPPDKLDVTIAELKRRLEVTTADVANRMSVAEAMTKPFTEVNK